MTQRPFCNGMAVRSHGRNRFDSKLFGRGLVDGVHPYAMSTNDLQFARGC